MGALIEHVDQLTVIVDHGLVESLREEINGLRHEVGTLRSQRELDIAVIQQLEGLRFGQSGGEPSKLDEYLAIIESKDELLARLLDHYVHRDSTRLDEDDVAAIEESIALTDKLRLDDFHSEL